MSFILDALKKLEREKAARSNSGVNISEEILRRDHRGRRTGKRSPTAIAVAAALAVLVTGGVVAGIMFWQRDSAPRETRELPEGGESRITASAVAEHARPSDADKAPAARELPPVAAAPLPTSTTVKSPTRRNPDRNPVATAGSRPHEDESEPNRVGAPPSGVDMKVSGIAWQEKRSARRAVVNGVLVPEGTTVGGATVKEIFQNRVRFQANGRTFDVYISGPLLGDAAPVEPPRPSISNVRPPQGDISLSTTQRRSMRIERQSPEPSGEH